MGLIQTMANIIKINKSRQVYRNEFEWYIEFNGELIGELINCKNEDMFWDSYEIVPINDSTKEKLLNRDLWELCKFNYKNKHTLVYAENAFPSIQDEHFDLTKRIYMRGLYI